MSAKHHSRTPGGNTAEQQPPQQESSPQGNPALEKTAPKLWRDGNTAMPGPIGLPGAAGADLSRTGVIFGRRLRKALAEKQRPTSWSQPVAESVCTDPLIVDRASDVSEASLSWLWPGRIPLGHLTLLAGHDLHAASQVAFDLAARLSRGSPWPGGPEPPPETAPPVNRPNLSRVFYASPHRDRALRTVPGLKQAGAEMQRIWCLDGVWPESNQLQTIRARGWRPFELPGDIPSLRLSISKLTDVQLIVLDPLEAFFERHASAKDREYAIEDLRELAWDFGLAVVGITRLKPQSAGRRALPEIENRALALMASIAWGVLPTGRSERQHLFVSLNGEMVRPDAALTFEIGEGQEAGRVLWSQQSFTMTAADLSDERNAGIKFAIASAWLTSELANGPRLVREIKQEALKVGISANMLRNVQKAIEVVSRKSGYQGDSTWELKSDADNGIDAVSLPAISTAAVDASPSKAENVVNPLNIGAAPSTLEDSCGICNVEGQTTAPQH